MKKLLPMTKGLLMAVAICIDPSLSMGIYDYYWKNWDKNKVVDALEKSYQNYKKYQAAENDGYSIVADIDFYVFTGQDIGRYYPSTNTEYALSKMWPIEFQPSWEFITLTENYYNALYNI